MRACDGGFIKGDMAEMTTATSRPQQRPLGEQWRELLHDSSVGHARIHSLIGEAWTAILFEALNIKPPPLCDYCRTAHRRKHVSMKQVFARCSTCTSVRLTHEDVTVSMTMLKWAITRRYVHMRSAWRVV